MLLIEFFEPPISMSLSDYMTIADTMAEISSSAGYCVSLGKKFFSEGVLEIDESIVPLLSDSTYGMHPRLVPSCYTGLHCR